MSEQIPVGQMPFDALPARPLRIALFTAFYFPFLSGVSFAVYQRVRWLLQRGHEILLVHPEIDGRYPAFARKEEFPNVEELQADGKFSTWAYPTKPLIFEKTCPEPQHHRYWDDTALLENFQPDIVIVEEAAEMRGFCSLGLGGYGRPVATQYQQRTGIPAISLFHTDWLSYANNYLGSWFIARLGMLIGTFARQFTSAYTMNYFPSQVMLDKYRKLGVERAAYLRFQGVDCQKFHPENIRFHQGGRETTPLLLYVGRLAREKNIGQLLPAFAQIRRAVPDARLVIVGSGTEEQTIRQQAAFDDQITVWGEAQGTELLGWYACADLFLNPSVTENFCTTNMEALASGVPVVAARAGGNEEQIVPGHNGLLSERDNPDDFAKQVISILSNPSFKAKLTSQARPSALEFDWTFCMLRFEKTLYAHVEDAHGSMKS
jgi:glycosyltransferase involved in cell wall biosynthesis